MEADSQALKYAINWLRNNFSEEDLLRDLMADGMNEEIARAIIREASKRLGLGPSY